MKTFEDSRQRFAVIVDTLAEAAVQSYDLGAALLTRTATSESQNLAEVKLELQAMRTPLPNGIAVFTPDFEALADFAQANGLGLEDIQDGAGVKETSGRVVSFRCVSKRISDTGALAALTSLESLQLSFNRIQDITALSSLTSLKELFLFKNRIQDISPLSDLTALTLLRISDNQIQDISALSRLTSLKVLAIDNNQIQDISALANLTSLNNLFLRNNRIEDITVLSGLASLTQLSLGGNRIQNISALSGLTSLKTLLIHRLQNLDKDAAAEFDALIDAFRGRGMDVRVGQQ